MHKLRVAILFGGRSAEHEVSLQSARNVIESLDPERYEPVLIGIDREGRWFLNENSIQLMNAGDPKLIRLSDSNREIALTPCGSGSNLISLTGRQNNGDEEQNSVPGYVHKNSNLYLWNICSIYDILISNAVNPYCKKSRSRSLGDWI